VGRWGALCDALGAPELGRDERFCPYDRLLAHGADAAHELAGLLRMRPTDEVVHDVRSARSMAARVYSPADVVACEHLAARSFWRSVPTAEGDRRALGPLLRFHGSHPACLAPAPRLGQHGIEELRGAGVA
jgi:crotonobetainyl-CoA:carnitine CoA-transferase CaiB-like acyl-CoA transferase